MRIFTCNSCSKIHLEIGNTQIHFADIQKLKKYFEYLNTIDIAYYAAINRNKGLTRVIIIPLDNCSSVHLGFTVQEFKELKKIICNYLSGKQKQIHSFTGLIEIQLMEKMNFN
ncbi:MAG: hypothetical protein LBT25_04185 [Candidatus Symbiothrix sp.]|jgi:hypothetical protein|nr:hypothetical protein [Candidatus Symbiothrix sp.]